MRKFAMSRLIKDSKTPFWHIKYRRFIDDKLVKFTTKKKTREEAEIVLAEFNEKYLAEYKLKAYDYKISDIIDVIALSYEGLRSKNHIRAIRCNGKHMIKHLGNKDIRFISRIQLQNGINEYFKLHPKSVKNFHKYIRLIFNQAKDWEIISESCPKLILPRTQKNAPIYMEKREFEKILEILPPRFHLMVKLGFYCGLRVGEIVKLKISAINLYSKHIQIGDKNSNTKTYLQRFVPIPDFIYNEVVDAADGKKYDDYLFQCNAVMPFTCGYISHSFKKAVRKLNFDESLKFHSLRHSYASNLAANDIPLHYIQELMGHTDIKTTQIYLHAKEKHLRSAVNDVFGRENYGLKQII